MNSDSNTDAHMHLGLYWYRASQPNTHRARHPYAYSITDNISPRAPCPLCVGRALMPKTCHYV